MRRQVGGDQRRPCRRREADTARLTAEVERLRGRLEAAWGAGKRQAAPFSRGHQDQGSQAAGRTPATGMESRRGGSRRRRIGLTRPWRWGCRCAVRTPRTDLGRTRRGRGDAGPAGACVGGVAARGVGRADGQGRQDPGGTGRHHRHAGRVAPGVAPHRRRRRSDLRRAARVVRGSAAVAADETGWRIDGGPQLAVGLRRRCRDSV